MADMPNTNNYLAFAVKLAREAGEIMRHYFELNDKQVRSKANNTLVTEADQKINQLLIDQVVEHFPTHGVLGEEKTWHAERNQLWVCDPIDGTASFILGIPTAMFSLAYVVDGKPIVAVMYEPLLNKLYTAEQGQGALLNGQAIKVSTQSDVQGSTIGLVGSLQQLWHRHGFLRTLEGQGASLNNVPGNVFKASLVAQGRLDAQIFPGRGAHDIAAEKLIIEEAGGRVTSLEGEDQLYNQPIRGAVVSNGLIHDQLVEYVRDFGIEAYLGY